MSHWQHCMAVCVQLTCLNGNVDDVIQSLVRAILRSSLQMREAFTPVKNYWIPVAAFLCWIPAATFSLLDSSSYISTLYWVPVATPQLCWVPALILTRVFKIDARRLFRRCTKINYTWSFLAKFSRPGPRASAACAQNLPLLLMSLGIQKNRHCSPGRGPSVPRDAALPPLTRLPTALTAPRSVKAARP